jgi:molybdenum cofactor guanylyltransferase
VQAGFVGAVLTGGASTRMGTDKAMLEIDGIPMAVRVALAMRAAGADQVLAIGGDSHALTSLGLAFVPDGYPGEGPLGGIITALRALSTSYLDRGTNSGTVVVTACDMPWIGADHITPLLDALAASDDVDVALSAQHLHAAWRPRALPVLEKAFADGERAPKRAIALVPSVTVTLPSGTWSVDLDSPDDIHPSFGG